MNSTRKARPATIARRSDRFHRWRSRKDKMARFFIALGGFAVIGAVLFILFYLMYVVVPLFLPANISQHSLGERQDWQDQQTVYLAIEEQQQLALRLNQSGLLEFVDINDLQLVHARLVTFMVDQFKPLYPGFQVFNVSCLQCGVDVFPHGVPYVQRASLQAESVARL